MFAHLLAFAGYLCIPWIHFPQGKQVECNLILLPTGKYTRSIPSENVAPKLDMSPCLSPLLFCYWMGPCVWPWVV